MLRVMIHLLSASHGIIYEGAVEAYVKGPFYCIRTTEDGKIVVHKFPIANIHKVKETEY